MENKTVSNRASFQPACSQTERKKELQTWGRRVRRERPSHRHIKEKASPYNRSRRRRVSDFDSARVLNVARSFKDINSFPRINREKSKSTLAYTGFIYSSFALDIKRYIQYSVKRPLNQDELRALMSDLKPSDQYKYWAFRDLSTIVHALTTAGVFAHDRVVSKKNLHSQMKLLLCLFELIAYKCRGKRATEDISPRCVSTLLWCVSQLVAQKPELGDTHQFSDAVKALLKYTVMIAERPNREKCFNAINVSNLFLSMGNLIDAKIFQFKDVEPAVTVLILIVPKLTRESEFNAQQSSNILMAFGKLVKYGLKLTDSSIKAINTVLDSINIVSRSKNRGELFKRQELSSILSSIATLLCRGLDYSLKLKRTLKLTLNRIEQIASFSREKDLLDIQTSIYAIKNIARIVDHNIEITLQMKKSQNVVLDLLMKKAKAQRFKFSARQLYDLAWSIDRMVGKGLKKHELSENAMEQLFTEIKFVAENHEKENHFSNYMISGILWSISKLTENEVKYPRLFEEVLHVLLRNISESNGAIAPGTLVRLIQGISRLGEAISIDQVEPLFDYLVRKIKNIDEFSPRNRVKILWGLAAYNARLFMDEVRKTNDKVDSLMEALFLDVVDRTDLRDIEKTTLAMVAHWFNKRLPFNIEYTIIVSDEQAQFAKKIRNDFEDKKIEEEVSLQGLPPVDLFLPYYNIAMEICGPCHYTDNAHKKRNGSTLLKFATLQKIGYETIEIPAEML